MTATALARQAAAVLRRRLGTRAKIAIVLGSGLAGIAKLLKNSKRVEFARVPGIPRTSVEGHPGYFAGGTIAGVPVILQVGRLHGYEGIPARTLGHAVWTLAALGIKTLVLTNSAGGIRRRLRPGTAVFLTDHINLSGQNPLAGPADYPGPRFPDISRVYDRRLLLLAVATAKRVRMPRAAGVYAGLAGPSYETPAEVAMLRRLGASVVGMSTVAEAIAAGAAGLKVLGVSIVANAAVTPGGPSLTHAQVLAAAEQAEKHLARWLPEFLAASNH